VQIYNVMGQYLWLTSTLHVTPNTNTNLATGFAERYPAEINVWGLEDYTNGYNWCYVQVTLSNLTCSCPSNLCILLRPPAPPGEDPDNVIQLSCDLPIMLMSGAGGTQSVTNATLVFNRNGKLIYPDPIPGNNYILSNGTTTCCETWGNYYNGYQPMPDGNNIGSCWGTMEDGVSYPNGIWRLYIYGTNNCSFSLDGWKLEFQKSW